MMLVSVHMKENNVDKRKQMLFLQKLLRCCYNAGPRVLTPLERKRENVSNKQTTILSLQHTFKHETHETMWIDGGLHKRIPMAPMHIDDPFMGIGLWLLDYYAVHPAPPTPQKSVVKK